MGALTAPKVSKWFRAGAVASMGVVASSGAIIGAVGTCTGDCIGVVAGAGAIIGAVGTCTGDCIGMVAGAGAPKEAVCSRGETAELISGV